MENVGVVRLWHAGLALVTAVALVLQTGLVLDRGTSLVNLFSYFTIQSNILVCVTAAMVAVRPTRAEPWFQAVRLAALVGITVTGVVYVTVLSGTLELEGLDVLCNALLHYVAPVAAVIGFVLLRPRTPMSPTAWWALAWPIVWLVYTLIRGAVSDPAYQITDTETAPVPYGFLDVDANGAGAVTVACLGVTAIAVLLAFAYVRLGRVRPASRSSAG